MGGETLEKPNNIDNKELKQPEKPIENKELSLLEQRRVNLISEYGKIAEGLRIKPVDISNSMRIDGKTFTDINNKVGEIPENVSDDGNAGTNTAEIGKYSANNSVLSWVNERGEKYIAPYNNENVGKLNSAGYKNEPNIFVPMSNGEKFGEKYNDKDRELWDQLQVDNLKMLELRNKINQQ